MFNPYLIVVGLLTGLFQTAVQAENLLVNAGFEEVEADGSPVGWESGYRDLLGSFLSSSSPEPRPERCGDHLPACLGRTPDTGHVGCSDANAGS